MTVRRSARWQLLVLAALLGVGACSPSLAPLATESAPPVADLGLPSCRDVEPIAAPAAWYRPQPVYVANEMPTDDVMEWAIRRPGYVDLWIDRDRQGWITVGFESGAPQRQAELRAAFPGVGAVAVEVPYSHTELERWVEQLLGSAADLGITGITPAVDRGVVEVDLGVLDPEASAALAARFPGAPLCVSGMDPAQAPEPGPQGAAGEGWRLLGHDVQVGPAYRTGIAADPDAYAALWAESGLSGEPPDVDFTTGVVLWFGAVTGSSCPNLRLDGIVVDPDRALLYADLVLPDAPPACTADIFQHSFVVAVERRLLPPGPFAIQLGPDDPPAGAPEERTVVDADLSVPGSVPGAGEVHPDMALLNPEPEVAVPGDFVEPGFEPRFRFPVRCGVEWLGPLNGAWWRTSDPDAAAGRLPDAWAAAVDADGTLTGTISMVVGARSGRPALLTVQVAGRFLRYQAVAGVPDCRE